MKIQRLLVLALTGVLAFGVAACGDDESDNAGGSGGSGLSGTIRADGSSTVGPIATAAAELFQEENKGVKVTVGTSGTGGGFEKFCAGETDLSNASREIKADEEVPLCEKAGIKFQDFQVANDGIALVVNPENDWAECLTVEQLKTAWDKGSKAETWKDIDPSFPDEKLTLAGPGTDSGTFDFFTKAINGEEGQSRADYAASEDDNVTVQTIAGAKGGLGYFGLSYAEQNKDKIKTIGVDGGKGCVTPSSETVQDASYAPLSRPLFVYVNDKAYARPEVKAFVAFFLENSAAVAEQTLFVPMTDEQLEAAQDAVAAFK